MPAHGMRGIGRQVHEHLMKLGRIGHDGCLGSPVFFYGDIRGQRRFQEIADFADNQIR
jgi:hypothetical protein